MARIDYLKWLGVDAVWLTPIYRSPFRDLGYDISDYCSIDRGFGTLDDFDGLVDALHEARIRVVLDLVPNHTADDHAWFVESSSSRNCAKSDWFIWADPAENGGPPNISFRTDCKRWEGPLRPEQAFITGAFSGITDLRVCTAERPKTRRFVEAKRAAVSTSKVFRAAHS